MGLVNTQYGAIGFSQRAEWCPLQITGHVQGYVFIWNEAGTCKRMWGSADLPSLQPIEYSCMQSQICC